MPLYSAKELNNIRKSVVLDTVIPCLEKQGFIRAPFLCANFGWDGYGEFCYDLIKLDKNNMMQTISLRFMNAWRSIYAAFSMYKLPSGMSMGDLSKINGLSILNEYGTIRRYQYSGHFISIKKLLRCSLTPLQYGLSTWICVAEMSGTNSNQTSRKQTAQSSVRHRAACASMAETQYSNTAGPRRKSAVAEYTSFSHRL